MSLDPKAENEVSWELENGKKAIYLRSKVRIRHDWSHQKANKMRNRHEKIGRPLMYDLRILFSRGSGGHVNNLIFVCTKCLALIIMSPLGDVNDKMLA